MANELPYFRFTVQAWQNGKINIEDFETQGLFISICGYYWIQDCTLTREILYKKYRNNKNQVDALILSEIIKFDKKTDKISIDFLNTQFDLLSNIRKTNQLRGKKGGEKKASNTKAQVKPKYSPTTIEIKPNSSYKDKDNIKIIEDKDKEKDKDNSEQEIFTETEDFETNKSEYYREFDHLKLSHFDFNKLLQTGFSQNQIDDVLNRVQNFAQNKKYKSLYLTALNWLNSDKEKNKVNGNTKANKSDPYNSEALNKLDIALKEKYGNI